MHREPRSAIGALPAPAHGTVGDHAGAKVDRVRADSVRVATEQYDGKSGASGVARVAAMPASAAKVTVATDA